MTESAREHVARTGHSILQSATAWACANCQASSLIATPGDGPASPLPDAKGQGNAT